VDRSPINEETPVTELPAADQHDSASSRQAYLLELASDAIFVCDLNGTISYWNAGAETLYGWPRVEALGQPSHELLQTAFPAPRSEITDQVIREGRWEGELIHTRRDGSKVNVLSRWALERDGDGHPEAILKLNTDVTQRKQEEARQAHLLRQAAAAGVSPRRDRHCERRWPHRARESADGGTVRVPARSTPRPASGTPGT
jgi:PAS domain S-box-containing protein